MMALPEVAHLHHERSALLSALIAEISDFSALTSTPMSFDSELFQGVLDFTNNFAAILSLAHEIAVSVDQFTQSTESTTQDRSLLLNRLRDERALLQRELETAKSMTKSVSSRAVSIKNQRLLPILDFLWKATNSTANAQILAGNSEFCATLFDTLNRADSRESVFAALGTLVNISASESGLLQIADSIGRNGFAIIPKIAEVCHAYGEVRTRQLSLYLVRNFVRHPDLAFQLIRENCFQWLCDFWAEFTEDREKALLALVLEALVSEKHEKTIRFCCRDSLERLLGLVEGADFLGIKARIGRMIGCAQKSPQPRFGFPRVYH
jgi:hypothetical protein